MLEIAAELSASDPEYAEMALKFVEHFLWIASSMTHLGEDTGMWDDQDGFFYDVLRLPDGRAERLKVRSMVGLLPLCAATVFDGSQLLMYPETGERLGRFLETRPEIRSAIHDPLKKGVADRLLASILDETKLRRVLAKMLDEEEFLSPFGIRSLSKYHEKNPFVMNVGGQEYRVGYLPAESDTGMFGGNSNWRGPIWMPVNGLIIRALMQYYIYYGDDFTVECPTPIPGQQDEPLSSGRGVEPPAVQHLPARQTGEPTGLRRHGRSSRNDPHQARLPDPLLRVLPRRQWRWAWSQPSDWLDWNSRAHHAHVRHNNIQASNSVEQACRGC